MFLNQPKPGLRHLLLITVILMFGCKKAGNTNEDELTPQVAQAKLWYNSAYTALKEAKHNATVTANKTFDFSVLINPDWQKALTYKRHGDEVVEIPVEQPGKFGVGLIGKGDAAIAYNPENSKTTFVLLKNAGGYRAFIMTLIADAGYLNGDYAKLQNNHYNKRDPKFSGVLVYYTPEGKYINNWTYKDGNLLSKQTVNSDAVADSNKATQGKKNAGAIWDCIDYYTFIRYPDGTESEHLYSYSDCKVVGYIDDSGTTAPPSSNPGGTVGSGGGPVQNPCATGSGNTQTNAYKTTLDDTPISTIDDGGYPPPTTVQCPTAAKRITNNVKDSCLKKMVDATISSNIANEINTLIKSVFGGSETMNIEFVDVSTLPSGYDGYFYKGLGMINGALNAQIQLNVNTMPNYSQEYIARVIMHESLHAYLESTGKIGDLQHEAMAVDYVTKMAVALQKMFPGLLEIDAKNLALGGLKNTDEFKSKISNDMKLLGDFVSTQLAYSVGTKGKRCLN